MKHKSKAQPTIPECKAFELCRELKVSCDMCLTLPVPEWVQHVEKILAK
jgi:hypothetical protein